jgi:hypothetical protein
MNNNLAVDGQRPGSLMHQGRLDYDDDDNNNHNNNSVK